MFSHFPTVVTGETKTDKLINALLLLAIITSPLLLTVLFANFLSPTALMGLLVALLAIGGAIFLLRQPFMGLLLLVFSTVMIPFSIGTGTGSTLNLPLLLVAGLSGLWLFEMFAGRREIRLTRSATFTPAIGLVITALLAFAVGQFPWYVTEQAPITAQLGGVGLFVLSVAAFLLAANRIETIQQLKWLVWVFLAFGGLLIIGRFLFFLPIRYITQSSVGSVFVTWLAALSFSQAVFNRELSLVKRGLLLLLTGLTFALVLFTMRAWASGWVPAGIALLVILWVARPRLALVLTILMAVIIAFNFQTIFNVVFVDDNNAYSLDTRLLAWQIVVAIAKVNPILGLGPANYYYYTPLYNIAGFSVQFNSHNQFIDLIAQTGVLGLFFFGWWAAAVSRLGLKLRSLVAPAGFAQAFVFGAMGALVGNVASGMLGDWVIPFVYNVGLVGFISSVICWFFLGGLVALEKITLAAPPSINSVHQS